MIHKRSYHVKLDFRGAPMALGVGNITLNPRPEAAVTMKKTGLIHAGHAMTKSRAIILEPKNSGLTPGKKKAKRKQMKNLEALRKAVDAALLIERKARKALHDLPALADAWVYVAVNRDWLACADDLDAAIVALREAEADKTLRDHKKKCRGGCRIGQKT